MRILILSNLYPPHILGGYEVACRNVAAALVSRGHEVRVLAGHAPMATSDPPYVNRTFGLRGYEPIPPPNQEIADARRFEAAASQYGNTAALLTHLRAFRPDLVYVWHMLGIGGMALLDLLQHVGVPWVMHLMGRVPYALCHAIPAPVAGLFARNDRFLFSNAIVITMSEHIITEIGNLADVHFTTKPVTIPGWVDTSRLPPLRPRGRSPKHIRFVAAGSLGYHKGTDVIVAACAQLRAAGHRNFNVDIFGLGVPEPWVAMATQYGVDDCINWYGPLPQDALLSKFTDYDAFLFPTLEREPFGFAPIEAAACGAIPIATRNAGCCERLVDRVHALKIDRTPESLADAMAELLSGSIDVDDIGLRTARYVRQELSFDRALDAIETVFDRVVRPWDLARVDDPKLPLLLYTKHVLGEHLMATV